MKRSLRSAEAWHYVKPEEAISDSRAWVAAVASGLKRTWERLELSTMKRVQERLLVKYSPVALEDVSTTGCPPRLTALVEWREPTPRRNLCILQRVEPGKWLQHFRRDQKIMSKFQTSDITFTLLGLGFTLFKQWLYPSSSLKSMKVLTY